MALPTHSLLQAACGLELSVLRINKGNRNARGNGQQEDKLGQREQVEKLEGLMLLLLVYLRGQTKLEGLYRCTHRNIIKLQYSYQWSGVISHLGNSPYKNQLMGRILV